MKKITLLISILCVFVTFGFAQEAYIDSRLDAVYSEDYLNDLVENNPQKINYLNWILDNSYTVVYAGIDKCQQMPYLKHFDPVNKIVGQNVESIDEANFNIFMYQFERKYDKKTYYRIGNTGYAIVLESDSKLTKNFNTYSDEN